MQSLEEIKRKISSTDSLKSIIRTMKLIASVNIRQYEKNLKTLTNFQHTIELSFQVALKALNKNNPYFSRHSDTGSKTGIVVLGSDLGLCGQFNEQIATFTAQRMAAMNLEPELTPIMAIGDKIVPRLEDAGFTITEKVLFPAGLQTGVAPVLQKLIFILEQWRDTRHIENVTVFFNKPAVELVNFEPTIQQLLPLDPVYLLELRNRKWESNSLPVFRMDVRKLLPAIIRSYLYMALHKAFVASLTAENAARLTAMQAAEKHIDEHILELRGLYNAERQESITSELLDIIAGFETMTTY